jgi:glycosyltransferase involved in cell wall biosynthesis
MKIKLSAVIITFNEEANLERCLTSLINVVDEIVVVDSFSSDNTKKVAQNFHVRFFENKFEGHIQQKTLQLPKQVTNMFYRWMQMNVYRMS